ncbi:MAG TPA: hypothetical protein VKV37_11030 [Ktedonobacteraceae bacterium]|nr:hypothetical protein [Ktedonobacteraceae bacterium]
MTNKTLSQQVQWGKLTLLLDHEEFRKGYSWGRRYYFEDINHEYPERARTMTALEAAQVIVVGTDSDQPHFDAEELAHPIETVGVFLGYMSGALIPETAEERQARLKEEAAMLARAEVIPIS